MNPTLTPLRKVSDAANLRAQAPSSGSTTHSEPRTRSSPALDLAGVALAGVVGRLPRRAASGLGAVVGVAASLVGSSKSSRARRNLERAGVQHTARACRRGWASTGRTAFEMLWMLSRPPDAILDAVSVRGLDEVIEAHRRGRGVLLVSAHAGNWETVPLAVARAGVRVAVVARGLRAPSIERRLISWRRSAGVVTLLRGVEGASVAAYRALAEGGALGCMMDRASTGRRVALPFLGGWTHVPLGPLALAARTGAAVVVGLARRHDRGRAEIDFRRVDLAAPQDLEAAAAAVMAAIEDGLRDRPEEWFWIYRRQPPAPSVDPKPPV